MFRADRGDASESKRPFEFTLRDLVVVIFVIGLLIALLLPAIQSSHGGSHARNQCANNLKQLALAALNHEATKRFLPSGGWGHNWIGDPDAGFGRNQPGGWAYSCLFYLESDAQIRRSADLSMEEKVALGATVVGAGPNASDNQAAVQPMFYCPSRRQIGLYPFAAAIAKPGAGGTNYGPTYPPYTAAKSDYAANGGTIAFNGKYNHGNQGNDIQAGELAESIAAAALLLPSPDATWYMAPYARPSEGAKAEEDRSAPKNTGFNGVAWYRSEVSLRMITDGTSKVYLFGEKYMDRYTYTSGYDGNGDEENLYVGMDDDNIRLGASAGTETPTDAPRSLDPKQAARVSAYGAYRYPPMQDAAVWPGRDDGGKRPPGVRVDKFNALGFGSPHPNGFNMAFCDGSIHAISYDIDPRVHAMLCDRQDGEAVDPVSYLAQ
jgi:prepilin-type processing-associated H-X9-DG protein